MNTFVMSNAVLYVAAAMYSAMNGRPAWGFVYLCYGLSAAVLAYLEGGK